MIELDEDLTNICIGYFNIDKDSRVCLTWNLYDVGCLQHYENKKRYCLWSMKSTGIFALLLQPSDHLLGYVLLIDFKVIEFFNSYGEPLDWWNWCRKAKDVRRPFYVDHGFRTHILLKERQTNK